jgi:hypothetical protein
VNRPRINIDSRKSAAAFTINLTDHEVGLLRHILTRALENPEQFGITNQLDTITRNQLLGAVQRIRDKLDE